jgi:type I restriction enzyme S subunit
MSVDGWRKVRVDELVAEGTLVVNDGYRVTNRELGPVGIPFVRGGDIGEGTISTVVNDHIKPEFSERVQNKLTKPGDVAFISKGTVGRVGFFREGQPSVVLSPQVCYWRATNAEKLDPRFLFFLLTGNDFQANLDSVKTHGSMVADYVSLSDQRGFYLTLPSIQEQRGIARILGGLDDKIHLNCGMNATLEAMARALFQAWFVDFEPVRAKAVGAKSFALMPQGDFDALPKRLVDSPRGLIPEGWRTSTIGEEVRVVGGGTPSTAKAEFWEDGVYPWATPRDLSKLESPVLIDTERRISEAGLACISSGLLPKRTVLLSSRAPIGYLAFAETPTAINQGFIAMVCEKVLPPEYILNWCAARMEEIKARANGTTFLEVSNCERGRQRAVLPMDRRS